MSRYLKFHSLTHGTSCRVAKNIKENGYRISLKGLLGSGFYLWDEGLRVGKAFAFSWALKKYREQAYGYIKKIACLIFSVSVNEDLVTDLRDKKIFNELKQKMKEKSIPIERLPDLIDDILTKSHSVVVLGEVSAPSVNFFQNEDLKDESMYKKTGNCLVLKVREKKIDKKVLKAEISDIIKKRV